MQNNFVPYALTSPAMLKGEIRLYEDDFSLAALDAEELNIFNAQFPTLLGAPGSEERRIQIERQDQYLYGLRAIKHVLKDPKFRGLNPSDTELGFGKIRPQFTRVGGAHRTNWQLNFVAAATWYDFLNAAAADTGFAVGEDFGLVVTHIQSLVTPTPFVAEVHSKIGRTDLIPSDVRPIRVGDNENGVAHYPLPTMFVTPKTVFWIEALADVAGIDEMPLGGIVVGLGRVLKETAPTWT